MFSQSKYTVWYDAIIDRAQVQHRSRTEHTRYDLHHIVPRCLGGSNDPVNTVLLTLREHYVCHLLLVKMTTGRTRSKMVYAFFRFNPKNSNVTSSRTFERFVTSYARNTTGENNPFYGRKHTAETLLKLSGQNHPMYEMSVHKLWVKRYGVEEAERRAARKNQRISENLKGARNGMFGKQHSPTWRQNHARMMTGSGNPNFGKDWCWINRDNVTKRIERHELDAFISQGWKTGRR